METKVVLACGCEREQILNGKWFWFYCEDHDEDSTFEKVVYDRKLYSHLDD